MDSDTRDQDTRRDNWRRGFDIMEYNSYVNRFIKSETLIGLPVTYSTAILPEIKILFPTTGLKHSFRTNI